MNADTAARIIALRARSTPGSHDGRVIPAGRPDAWLSLDPDQHLHLMLRADPADHPPGSLEQVRISPRDYIIDDNLTSVVDVTCADPNLQDVFEHFIDACLNRPPGTGNIAALTLELNAWKTFLTPAPGPPGIDRCAEFFGELLVATDLCLHDPTAVRAWVATRHDFRAGTAAIEVKTTRSTTGHTITVHGIDQLEPPGDGSLYLHVVRVEHTPGHGRSVADLVDDLLGRGAPAELVYLRAEDHHIAAAQISQTRQHTFDIRERVTLPITAGTPRLTTAELIGGQLPPGVSDLSYRLDLTDLLTTKLDDAAWRALTTALAADAARQEPGA